MNQRQDPEQHEDPIPALDEALAFGQNLRQQLQALEGSVGSAGRAESLGDAVALEMLGVYENEALIGELVQRGDAGLALLRKLAAEGTPFVKLYVIETAERIGKNALPIISALAQSPHDLVAVRAGLGLQLLREHREAAECLAEVLTRPALSVELKLHALAILANTGQHLQVAEPVLRVLSQDQVPEVCRSARELLE